MKSIFEIINENFDFVEEVLQLRKLFENDYLVSEHSIMDIGIAMGGDIEYKMSFESYIDKRNFKQWTYRGTVLNVESYKKRIGINEINKNSDENTLILYLEYVYNMIIIFDKNCHYDKLSLSAILQNIDILLSKVNLIMRKIDDKKYIVTKNKKGIDKALINTEYNIGILLVEYLDVKIKFEDKESILKELAKYFEGEKKKYTVDVPKIISDIYNDNQYYFNNFNIRHNNLKGSHAQPKVIEMEKAELEKIYDGIFNNCIILLSSIDNKEFILNTTQIKKDIPNK